MKSEPTMSGCRTRIGVGETTSTIAAVADALIVESDEDTKRMMLL
jgi:hypothetical protein